MEALQSNVVQSNMPYLAINDWGAGQNLSFHCMQTALALPIDRVREIIEYGQVTTVPLMPNYIRGVINLRGNVVPVIDLAQRFGASPTEIGRRTCIIILELPIGNTIQPAGLIVDSVDEVLDIDPGQIEPPPEFGAGISSQFILGMARRDNGFLIILKAEALFSADELQRMQESRGVDISLRE
ncbi:chemotaxis protein CheW [Tolumonas lignilytica]|jgi:Chemotaxis signal transduction protein|uniref:chemotaxis protein CheW n=1 Tax=Tolumonas lignilytica TaxID=1283284 RepID=UPI0004B8063A|nr:chemotaxis protein CheW [Tolumonas lignilytica]